MSIKIKLKYPKNSHTFRENSLNVGFFSTSRDRQIYEQKTGACYADHGAVQNGNERTDYNYQLLMTIQRRNAGVTLAVA